MLPPNLIMTSKVNQLPGVCRRPARSPTSESSFAQFFLLRKSPFWVDGEGGNVGANCLQITHHQRQIEQGRRWWKRNRERKHRSSPHARSFYQHHSCCLWFFRREKSSQRMCICVCVGGKLPTVGKARMNNFSSFTIISKTLSGWFSSFKEDRDFPPNPPSSFVLFVGKTHNKHTSSSSLVVFAISR